MLKNYKDLKVWLRKNKIAIFVVLITGIICGISIGGIFAFFHDLPEILSLETYRPSAVTRIYSADDVLLTELYREKREPVPIGIIPHDLISAIVATEDKNFYRHSGIDLKGILRAVIKDIVAGEFVEGASTITQQLAKTLFLSPRKTLLRKIKEAFLAFQLERRYTKNEILELYLNQVYFGSGAYGVESAARTFFDKSVKNLTLAESALIAGMPKAPSRYSPLVNQDLAIKRRNTVLKQMNKTGIIDERLYHDASTEPLLLESKRTLLIKAPYFIQYIKRFLEDALGSAMLYKGGLTVHTSLSYEMQKVAEAAVKNGLSALENRMKQHHIPSPDPQCALICLDVRSGKILTMVGGKDFNKSAFNRSTEAKRQPGSAFKPIVYALAIEQGFSQNHKILDAPIVFKNQDQGKDWEPENFSKSYLGEITLRKALTLSQNIPAVRLIEMIGPSSVVRFSHRLGIGADLSPNLSLALGTSEVSLIDLTAAYAVFANRGERIEPYGILKVADQTGRTIWRAKPQKQIAMSRAGAAITTNMLQGVVNEGTGKSARKLKRPLAGKTGTTNQYKDALFIGFSPSIAAGVWVGQDRHVTIGNRETGARAALPIWIDFMEASLSKKAFEYFDIPDNVVQMFMDPSTGFISSDEVPGGVGAMFRSEATSTNIQFGSGLPGLGLRN